MNAKAHQKGGSPPEDICAASKGGGHKTAVAHSPPAGPGPLSYSTSSGTWGQSTRLLVTPVYSWANGGTGGQKPQVNPGVGDGPVTGRHSKAVLVT